MCNKSSIEPPGDDIDGAAGALLTPLSKVSSFIRFGFVGVLATAAHGAVLVLLINIAGIHPTLSNAAAFLGAVAISYLGHYHFSFRSLAAHAGAAPKFFAAALLGLGLNLIIFAVLVNGFALHYMIAFAAVIVIVPPVLFIISNNLIFASRGDAKDTAGSS